MAKAEAPKISAIGVIFRIIGSLSRLIFSGATAWYRDGSTRMEGDEAATMRLLEGVPQYLWIESLNGITGGATPLYVLRLFPQPDAVYSLLYRRKLWPTAITWAMVASTTEIPVLPHEELHLVHLCQEALFSHPLWLGSSDKDDVRAAVARSRSWLMGQTPNQGHTQPALCRTKKGF